MCLDYEISITTQCGNKEMSRRYEYAPTNRLRKLIPYRKNINKKLFHTVIIQADIKLKLLSA